MKKTIPIDNWFRKYFKGLISIVDYDGFLFYYKQLNIRTALLFELNTNGGVASLLLIPAKSETDIRAFLDDYVEGRASIKFETIVDNLNNLTDKQKDSFITIESITDNNGYNHPMFTLQRMGDFLNTIIYLE